MTSNYKVTGSQFLPVLTVGWNQ